MNSVPRWRLWAAAAVLAALAFFTAMFAPVYARNLKLQSFVASLPHRVAATTAAGAPPSDEAVRKWVLDKARELKLPVEASDVQILRSAENARVERIEVKYMVRVDFPGYTVNLHFYPGAGSR